MRALVFACSMVMALSGCAGTYPRELDPSSNVVQIVWSDGKAASLVSCAEPSACDRRISTLCKKRFERLSIELPLWLGANWVVRFRCV